MQNDVLKNEIAPWQEKGRWYHGSWDLAAASWIADETDAFLLPHSVSPSSSVQYIYIDSDHYIAVDSKIIPRSKLTLSGGVGTFKYRYGNTGNSAVPIAPVGTSGVVDVYVFVKFI